jgi:hypothetical protein
MSDKEFFVDSDLALSFLNYAAHTISVNELRLLCNGY